MRAAIGGLLILLCAGALAQEQTGFNLDFGDGTNYTFGPVADPRQLGSLYGSYQSPISYTGGDSLRIYPNKRFTVIAWCDIYPESLLATGTYSFDNGIFAFSYTYKKEGTDNSRFPIELVAYHGWIDMKSYVTGSKYILIKPDDLAKARGDTGFVDYLRQTTWYPDWQSMYNNDVGDKK